MIAYDVPSVHQPAMTRELGPILRTPRPLRYGERHDMLIEANRAARRKIPINGQVIHPFAVSVLMELDDHYNMQEGVSRPSRALIARNLGAEETAVSRAFQELVQAGFIVREQRNRRIFWRFRGPLYAHHLRTGEAENVQQSDTGVTYEAHESDTGVIPKVQTGDTGVIPEVTPVSPPIKNPVKEPGKRRNPVLSDPPIAAQSPGPDVEPTKKPNRTTRLLDALDALGIQRPKMRPQDHKALKDTDAEPELVAEAWASFWKSGWRDDWVTKNPTIQTVVGKINAYILWRDGGARQQKQRLDNRGPSYEEAAAPGYYDDWKTAGKAVRRNP